MPHDVGIQMKIERLPSHAIGLYTAVFSGSGILHGSRGIQDQQSYSSLLIGMGMFSEELAFKTRQIVW